MERLTIEISEDAIKEIGNCYERADEEAVRNVIEDILGRYLNIEHFDPELRIGDQNS